ncbi:2TM domain-containing protein [Brachybacterium sp. AOP25-B2-12]|uniref:2TM domain-containing protein n=1 Tax=Brachybacterium sp. AOP25-B2-12 TaxID=3457710 RepID=UPI004033DCAC
MSEKLTPSTAADDPDLRRQAVQRLNARRAFVASAAMWIVINAFLVVIWSRSGGFFWPIFPLLFWGLAIFWQGMAAFGPRTTEDQIQREMRRASRGR